MIQKSNCNGQVASTINPQVQDDCIDGDCVVFALTSIQNSSNVLLIKDTCIQREDASGRLVVEFVRNKGWRVVVGFSGRGARDKRDRDNGLINTISLPNNVNRATGGVTF
jgi:hypothetical protein